jgi:predicted dehydrogenase
MQHQEGSFLMGKQVVFGLIGIGGISWSQHLPNLTRARNLRLKTICDVKAEPLEQARLKYGIGHVTQDHRELLSDPEIQAVVIATRADSHVPLALEALKAGKHVYVEKPLAETVEECRLLLPAQKKSGKILAVGHNRRMAPAYQQLKKILQAHGGPRNIHYRIADNLYVWGPGAGVEPGTRVVHEVCHVFDLLRYLTDSEVTSIYCVASRPDDEVIVLTFESGCVASIMSSGFMTQDMPKESLEAVVDIGGAIVTDFVELRTFGLRDFESIYRFAGRVHPSFDTGHRYLFEKNGAESMMDLRRIFWEKQQQLEDLEKAGIKSHLRSELEDYVRIHAPNPSYMMNKGWKDCVEHLADCILDGRSCELSSAEDGLKTMMLAEVAIQSRRSGQVVRAPFRTEVDGAPLERIEVTIPKPPRRPAVRVK